MNLTLTAEQIVDLVSLLGAADSMMRDLAQENDTPGIFRTTLTNQARAARELQAEITRQHNEQVQA